MRQQDVARRIVFATWVGIASNIVLALAKLIVGLTAKSQALLADAIHSASDAITSVVALFGVKISERPPDREHPYGHGKAEHIASIIMSIVLIFVGIQMALSAARTFFGGLPVAPDASALMMIVVSIILKEVLFHYKNRLGTRYKSPILITEAWHHRSDSLSSAAALIGVGIALVGKQWDITPLLYGDAFAGVIVSLMIIKLGVSLTKKAALVMMEQVLDEKHTQPFISTALAVNGVMQIDELLARSHGRYFIIDIKVSVAPDLTVEQGHAIGKQVKHQLMMNHADIEDVLVHINPYGPKPSSEYERFLPTQRIGAPPYQF